MPIRVFLADDHAILRRGLRALLNEAGDFEVVGEAASGLETLKELRATRPDVLILDIRMPGGVPASTVVREALGEQPDLAIVVLTMHEDEYYMREMFQAGARAFVLKKSAPDNLAVALRAATMGQHFVDPAMAGRLVPAAAGRARPSQSVHTERLTPREREVCKLLALGHTNAEVAQQLCISPRTVETHRNHIMKRLNLASRAELVRYAIDEGLLRLD